MGTYTEKYIEDRVKRLQKEVDVLRAVIDNLCEQQERQLDMEEASYRCSYPSKFPEWEQAWEWAREVRWGR